MAEVKLICRVCGKSYTACKTRNWGVWRWQDVACSRECGMIYLERITKAREENRKQA